MLKSEAFHQDPRIEQAKKLVIDALKDHQKKLAPKAADPGLKPSYQALIEEFSELRGGKLWHPYLGSGFGKGTLVELLDGSVKYDFISGIGVHYFGHSHPDIIEACFEASLSDVVIEGHLQQNLDALELSRLFVKASGLPHIFLSSSGAMANENALKLILQKKTPASRILAFERCFAGRTLALAQITDKAQYREGLPTTLQVDYIPFYHPDQPDETFKVLKQHLIRYPKQHAAMMVEFIQGEAGSYTAPKAFFHELAALLKEHHIALFADEVQTFARTPSLFAFQEYDIKPDLVTFGKLSQVCGTLFTQEYAPKPGLLSQTFTASVSSLRASRVILEKLTTGAYFGPHGRLNQVHSRFSSHFEKMGLHGPYGIGAMLAFTLPDSSYENTQAFIHRLFDNGLIAFIAGNHPARVRFLPPALVITDKEIDEACDIIKKSLEF